MVIQNILNIFVISLCLATIFITIVTYFLYRVKQLLKFNQKSNNQIFEGVFFKKYAPHVKLKEKDIENEFDNKLNDRKSLTNFFGIISGIIFISLTAGYLFSYFKLGEKTINSSKYEELISDGILKEYQLNTIIKNSNTNEFISKIDKDNFKDVLNQIRSTRIGIFEYKKIKYSNYHDKSVDLWKNYFNRNKIDFKILTNLKNIKNVDLIILPQMTSLNDQQKRDIEILLNNKISIISTGAIGYLNRFGYISHDKFSEKIFKVLLLKNENKNYKYTTVFKSNSVPWSGISSGVQINHFPTDNEYIAISKNGSSSIFESNNLSQIHFYGQTKNKIIRSNFSKFNKTRVVWLAIDPPNLGSFKFQDLYYLDYYFARSIQWSLGTPMAVISDWKGGAESAFVPSIQVDDESDNYLNYKNLFIENNFPLSIFISADDLIKKPVIVEEEKNKLVEIASSSENNSILQGNSLQNQFQSIQNSRLIIEGFWQNKVFGLYPPQSKF